MTHQKPAGELSGGLFVFARGAMHRQLLPAADGEREFWKRPSPSRLRRATSPERERLWQRRKAYRLSADVFLPLTGEDESYPLCQGLHLSGKTSPGRGKMSPVGDKKGNELSSAARLRGFVPEATLSVTASPCHLSRKGEALAKAESLCFTGQLVLSLTNKDETCPLCQGLHLSGKASPGRGKMSPQATERVCSPYKNMARADAQAM